MIITRLRGGLGNQMFQYALGRVLSIIHSKALKLDITGYNSNVQGDTPRAYRLGVFNIEAEIATPEEVQSAKYPLGIFSKAWRAINQKVLKKHYVDYHPEILNRKHTTYLDGFFQSEKYYQTANENNFQEILRKDFKIKDKHISPEMKLVSEKIQSSNGPSVSIHIRRGDYVTNISANKTQGLCSIEYYEQAIREIQDTIQVSHFPELHFFIFSDDIEWVKQNLSVNKEGGTNSVTYVSDTKLQDYEELILMSHCSHNIIANSSFSWWGAWLNENPSKIVIAPKQWTVKNSEHPNIIPEKWIKI